MVYLRGDFLNSTNYRIIDDNTLVALSNKGDEKAFDELFFRYIRLICSVAKKYKADGYDAGDFLQEGSMAFLTACKTFSPDGGSSFKNYAVICVRNRFNDIVKRTAAKSAVPPEDVVHMGIFMGNNDEGQSVEDYVLEREYLKALTEYVFSVLSDIERHVFGMYLEGYSYREISDITKLTLKQVDNMLQKIKRKIRSK